MTEPGADRVECYSGHTYAQEPRVVVWQGRRFAVVHIERRWRTPEGPAFVVETEAGIRFELHYGGLEDTWTIRPPADVDAEVLEPAGPDQEDLEHDNHSPADSKSQSP